MYTIPENPDPAVRDPGHSIVSLKLGRGPELFFHHSVPGASNMTEFVQIKNPAELGILLSHAKIPVVKVITAQQYTSALAAATSHVGMGKQSYNIRHHNCATTCAKVIDAAGYKSSYPTNARPSTLHSWFKTQR